MLSRWGWKCHCCKRLGPIIFLKIKNISGRSGVLAAQASYRDTKKKKTFKLAEMISCLMYDRKTSQSCAKQRLDQQDKSSRWTFPPGPVTGRPSGVLSLCRRRGVASCVTMTHFYHSASSAWLQPLGTHSLSHRWKGNLRSRCVCVVSSALLCHDSGRGQMVGRGVCLQSKLRRKHLQ